MSVLISGIPLAAMPSGGLALQLFLSLAVFAGVGMGMVAIIIILFVLNDRGKVDLQAFLTAIIYLGYLTIGSMLWLWSLIWLPDYPGLAATLGFVLFVGVAAEIVRDARNSSVNPEEVWAATAPDGQDSEEIAESA